MLILARGILFPLLLVSGFVTLLLGIEATWPSISSQTAIEVLGELWKGRTDRVSDVGFVYTLAAWIVSAGAGFLLSYTLLYGIYVPFQISAATRLVRGAGSRRKFTEDYARIHIALSKHPLVGLAWGEFDETLVKPEASSQSSVVQNTVRPNVFINPELIRGHSFALKMMPSIPGYFVGVGLLLTFVGLVLALSVAGSAVSSGDSGQMQGATEELLRVASFKFATSIAGLGTSIALGIAFRSISIIIETRCTRLCSEIEAVLLYRSPQSIFIEMASDLREQRDYLKDITQGDFFQRFGQEFEPRLKNAVASAMAPVVFGIESAVSEFSNQSKQGTEELIGRFTESLQQGTGEEMRALGSALEGIRTSLVTVQGTLQDTGRDFGQDIKNAGVSLAETLTRAAATAEAFERAASNVRRSTEPLLESGNKISNAVDKMEASLVKTADSLEVEQKAIAELSRTLADQMRQQEELWSRYGSRFEGIDGALGAALDRLSNASREQGERLVEYAQRVDEGLAEAVDKLRAFLGGLDENTQDLSESVENLARTLKPQGMRKDGAINDSV